MGRCNNETLMKKIGVNTLDQNTDFVFRLRHDLPDCRKINTKNYVATSAAAALAYNKYKKPVNRFECDRTGCITTGVLTMNESNETVTYRAMFDATEWAQGVVTFYVMPDAAIADENYPITVALAVSEAIDFANADIYSVSVTKDQITDDGFVPVMVNLANTPSSVEGNGWTPDSTGAFLRLSANQKVGFSSISIYDSIEDFDLLETVLLSCLTSLGGTFDLEVVQQRCQEAKYNDQVDTLNFPVTGTRISPNYLNLFPMARKDNQTQGFDLVNVEKTVGADGKITFADLDQNACGWITIQADDACDVGESTYIMSSGTSVDDVDDGHYIVVKKQDGSTDIVFNRSQAGVKVLVQYPKRAEIERLALNADNLNSAQLSVAVPYMHSDGTRWLQIGRAHV